MSHGFGELPRHAETPAGTNTWSLLCVASSRVKSGFVSEGSILAGAGACHESRNAKVDFRFSEYGLKQGDLLILLGFASKPLMLPAAY